MFCETLSIVNDMRAVGYAHVSTERQADRGVSLEAQEAKVCAMAKSWARSARCHRGRRRVGEKPKPAWAATAALAGERRKGRWSHRSQARSTNPVRERSLRPIGGL